MLAPPPPPLADISRSAPPGPTHPSYAMQVMEWAQGGDLYLRYQHSQALGEQWVCTKARRCSWGGGGGRGVAEMEG